MPKSYDEHKESARIRQAEISEASRDCYPLPKVKNKKRKAAAARSFRKFCETYLAESFPLAWSKDHLKVIAKIEAAVLRGGLFAVAMPRGSGKTTLAETACIWAILYGHRAYVVLIGASKEHAEEMLDSIKAELEANELLLDDFPEACHPIRRLEGIANRCRGQLYNGERTRILWKSTKIILPTIPKSAASGAIVQVAGITGRIRGMKHKRPDGKAVRPDLVIPDDPQTDESAHSVTQNRYRKAVIAGAVLGLAGPGKKIAGVMPCTVICPGDLADTILDRSKHPEWSGERTKLVYRWPSADKLWDTYRELRAEALRNGDPTAAAATEFYRNHRDHMDEGAEVAWPERHNPDELSAIQHAFNLRFQDPAAFEAEYQNDPIDEQKERTDELTIDQVAGRACGIARGVLPINANTLTSFVDVHQNLLYWAVCGWEADFTGHIVDYGTWPDQKRSYFALSDARRTLGQLDPRAGVEGSLRRGLEELINFLFDREWKREDGTLLRISRGLIDAGWKSDVVAPFCRQSRHAALLYPSKGRGYRAIDTPMLFQRKQQGEQRGRGVPWRILRPFEGTSVRRVEFDSNFWKSFIAARLRIALGDREALSLFGQPGGTEHLLFAEHLTAEYGIANEARGNRVDEWLLRPNRDNHWLDCVVGCAVAAAIAGVILGPRNEDKPKTVPLAELRRRGLERKGRS